MLALDANIHIVYEHQAVHTKLNVMSAPDWFNNQNHCDWIVSHTVVQETIYFFWLRFNRLLVELLVIVEQML